MRLDHYALTDSRSDLFKGLSGTQAMINKMRKMLDDMEEKANGISYQVCNGTITEKEVGMRLHRLRADSTCIIKEVTNYRDRCLKNFIEKIEEKG